MPTSRQAFRVHSTVSLSTILSPIQHRAATECARLSVKDVFGNLVSDEALVEVRVVDVSKQGMGMLVGVPLTQGSHVTYKVVSPVGELSGQAQVRYCRLDASGNGLYRVGVRLEEQSRVEQSKWTRLIEQEGP